MSKLMFFFCLWAATVSATFLFKSGSNSASNICIYSVDPDQYDPKCFLCPNLIYPTALQTCTNGTIMPNNVTYTQAKCIERNCAINYPQLQQGSKGNSFKKFGSLVDLFRKFTKRSVSDGSATDGEIQANWGSPDSSEEGLLLQLKGINLSDKEQNIRITQNVETFASDVEFEYPDY